jgi:anti-sigma regulatory factor (Ser/Thr protein kinase)
VAYLVIFRSEHGGGKTIELRVVGDDASVCIEVTDAAGTNSTPRPGATTDSDSEHGRGLALVEALAQRWGVRKRPDHTTVWAEISKKPRPAGSAR